LVILVNPVPYRLILFTWRRDSERISRIFSWHLSFAPLSYALPLNPLNQPIYPLALRLDPLVRFADAIPNRQYHPEYDAQQRGDNQRDPAYDRIGVHSTTLDLMR
jgi:hypothetical protein